MSIPLHRFALALFALFGAVSSAPAAEAPPRLAPGSMFTVQFPEMPPTFFEMAQHKGIKAQMTVFLPRNYDPARKHPLFLFLSGGDGGSGGYPGIARTLTEEKDFVCVSVPLFKVKAPEAPGGNFIMRDEDGRYMWPFLKKMLEKLDALVPNLDPAHQVLGGFSNGAHAIQGLVDQSDGEVARRFTAFFFGEGGGRMQHFDLLKGKPYLMLSSNAKSLPRAQQIHDTAKAAGAQTTLLFEDIGKHGFPEAAYPKVREWLRGPAMQ